MAFNLQDLQGLLAKMAQNPAAQQLLSGMQGGGGMPGFVQQGTMSLPISQLSGFDPEKARAQVAGEEQTPAALPPQYQKQYNSAMESPYVSFPNTGWAAKHPHLAGAFDNALLAMRSIKPPTDAAGRPVPTGAGYGIGQVASALSGLPAQKVAYREQLAEEPLKYQTAQAQLKEALERGTLEHEQAVTQAGLNASRVGSTAVRDLYDSLLGSLQRFGTSQDHDATQKQIAAMNDLTKLQEAGIRASAMKAHFAMAGAKSLADAKAQAEKWQNKAYSDRQKFFSSWTHMPDGSYMRKVGGLPQTLDADGMQAILDKTQNDIEDTFHDMLADLGVPKPPVGATHSLTNPKPPKGASTLPQGGGKQLTDAGTWQQFLKAAGGDARKAADLAAQNGWK